ncbi:MAG: M20/M25/M40 family metallo-hydrolase, partial [Pyrinomonadaceae bacterium]
AYPAVGASAILCAARIINRIEEIASRLAEDRREDFDPPYTTLNVGVIRGGTAKNIIPGECHFTLEWRPIPGQPASQVADLVSEVARREADRTPGCDARVTVLRLDEAMETPADSPLVQMLERATGKRSGTVAFGTEAPQMIALGAHAVVLGPGNIREAHRTGEFVPIDELNRCAEILRQAVSHFCL